jgi:O-acetyl-ADP-ribose deacetylase (regulator of RNase III)
MDGLRIFLGDITQLALDAIVNAANQPMLGGGGVDGAIHRAAGPGLLEACRQVTEVRPGVRCPTGEARITPGFELRAKFVIHTVGPVFHSGDRNEDGLLAACYRSCLELAAAHGVTSIAFPAISCGVYRFPPERASAIAVREVGAFAANDSCVREIVLVAFDATLESTLQTALKNHEVLT